MPTVHVTNDTLEATVETSIVPLGLDAAGTGEEADAPR